MTASTADSYQARLRLRSQSNVCKCSPFLLLSPLCPGHSHPDPILNHSQSLNHTSWIQALALWPFSTWSGHSLLPGAFRGLYSFSLSIDFFSPLLPVSPQAMEPFCSPHMSTPALHMLVPLPRVPFLTSLPELLLIRQEPLPLRRLPWLPTRNQDHYYKLYYTWLFYHRVPVVTQSPHTDIHDLLYFLVWMKSKQSCLAILSGKWKIKFQ